MIRIRKTDVSGSDLFIGEKWVTNGHWAIVKAELDSISLQACESVATAQVFYRSAKVEALTDKHSAYLSTALPPTGKAGATYEKTPWVNDDLGNRLPSRLFLSTEPGHEGRQLWIQEAYVELFDLGNVQAHPGEEGLKQGITNGIGSIVVMPIKAPESAVAPSVAA